MAISATSYGTKFGHRSPSKSAQPQNMRRIQKSTNLAIKPPTESSERGASIHGIGGLVRALFDAISTENSPIDSTRAGVASAKSARGATIRTAISTQPKYDKNDATITIQPLDSQRRHDNNKTIGPPISLPGDRRGKSDNLGSAGAKQLELASAYPAAGSQWMPRTPTHTPYWDERQNIRSSGKALANNTHPDPKTLKTECQRRHA